MWQRWNQTTHIFEKSDNDGGTWTPIGLSADIITEGTLAALRLGSGTPSSSNFLRGDSTWQPISLQAFPIGSVFISIVSTNPATLLGYGTWTAFGTGRTIVGIDAGQSEFDVVEETGGTKTHTLSSGEMPSHTHVQNAHNHAITDPGHAHTQDGWDSTVGDHDVAGGGAGQRASEATASATTGITINNATPTNQNTGGGGAHNNLQPYIVVYMWKRTA